MPEKTPAQKMFLKPGKQVRLVNAPENAAALLGGLPDGVTVWDGTTPAETLTGADAIVLFVNHRAELEALLPGLRAALPRDGLLWVAYHKGTSRIKTDIHRDSINAYAATLGLTGVAMISIDEDWSALRLRV